MKFETGDIGFVHGDTFIAKLINFGSFGKSYDFSVSHAFMFCRFQGDLAIYETEGGWGGAGRSGFVDYRKYHDRRFEVYRPLYLTDAMKKKIEEVCIRRSGTPYSYWDCTVNGFVFWLHPVVKNKIAKAFGNKKFTKCDEEVRAVMNEAAPHPFFDDEESGIPQELRNLLAVSHSFQRIYPS